MRIQNIIFLFLLTMIISGCKSFEASTYNYPNPVDTSDKPIELQKKETYSLDGVYADNEFDGARLNDFQQVNENTFRAVILPENHPINKSPWFSFRIWSEEPREINLILDYEYSPHRYIPKLSMDRKNWNPIDTNEIIRIDSLDIQFELKLNEQKMYVSGQELITSSDVYKWCDSLSTLDYVETGIYGKSVKGKDLVFLDIFEGEKEDKPMVVLLGRQHPPELSGYIAMKHFIYAILDTNVLSKAYRKKYRTLVLPFLNPDGVDMGHWRHNAHGVDLNRDWGIYVQPEIKQSVDFIVREHKTFDNEVVLGIDFHSTQKDLYYTYVDSMVSVIPRFKDYWLFGIDEAIPDYEPLDEPYGISDPNSKVWFYTQFGAEGIIYEVGDETPREFVKRKASISAKEMMKLLMFYRED